MKVQTTRFGEIEVDDDRLINFRAGLLGFSSHTQYALLQPDDEGVFFWLQATDGPDLAFVVTDPSLWVPEYQATIRAEQMEELGMTKLDEAQIFVIVNRYDRTLTANLQGPIVVNVDSRDAMQLVLADKKWTTRHELVTLSESKQAVSA